jgi:hypothetical protein
MLRRLIYTGGAIAAVLAVFTGNAAASGPAPPGKILISATCEGTRITVSVQRGETSKGAGQIVGAKGHGITVAFTFTLTDVNTVTVLNTESRLTGGGNAHPNQATTTCSGVTFLASAEELFGEELPPGVSKGDTIEGSFVIQGIFKP